MAIVGFNFNKISVEKKESVKGKISINNNITITNVEKKDLILGVAKQDGIRFEFEFTSKYEPKFADITLGGEVLFLGNSEEVKKVIDEWKKGNNIPKDVKVQVINAALTKCNIEALILSKEVNLPPPIPLPSVEATASTKEK
jgi:hypothetical protein